MLTVATRTEDLESALRLRKAARTWESLDPTNLSARNVQEDIMRKERAFLQREDTNPTYNTYTGRMLTRGSYGGFHLAQRAEQQGSRQGRSRSQRRTTGQ